MFLNAGWIGGSSISPWCCSRLVLVCAKSCATAEEKGSAWCWSPPLSAGVRGEVIDRDHWRHFYLLMAMIWGMALAAPYQRQIASRPATSQHQSARRLPDQTNDQEQQNRAERGGDDGGEDTTSEVKAEARKQGAAISAPTMPTKISPSSPKPVPWTSCPASHPAIAPIRMAISRA